MEKIIRALFMAFIISFGSSVQAQTTLKNTEIMPCIGSWQGTLTYLDYTSKQNTVIPADLDIEQISLGIFTFSHHFPKEPHVSWLDTMAISKDGMYFGNEKIITKRQLPNGNLELITEEKDSDDHKPALLRRTYTIGNEIFSRRKEVQLEGTAEWLLRHEYRYEIRAKYLTPKQMKADLGLIKTTWEILHPGLYRYNTKAEIENYFKDLDTKTNITLEQREFFILISQLNIKLRCGHSFVSYYNNKRMLKNNLYSDIFIPVLFTIIDNKFIVTHNLSDDKVLKLGEEIISINGISTQVIIDSLLTVSKADGRNGLNKQLDNISFDAREIYTDRYTLFDIFFPLFFKKDLNELNFNLTIKTIDDNLRELTVTGLSKEARQAEFIKRYGDIPRNENSWYIKPVDNQTAIFRVGDFMTYKWKFDFNRYLDSVFVMMNAKGYQNLIVDIRKNEGGADEARNAVLSYLTPKDLGCAIHYRRLYRYNQVPDSLNAYLSTWDDDFRKPKPDSIFLKTSDGFYESRSPNKCVEVFSKPNHFKGKIYLITDVTNSSATFILADVFKKNKLGTIVGETTGGTQQGINGGEIFFFYLPNSKIEMDLPLIYQAPNTARPDEGIKPDYDVKTTISDFAKMRDPQMEYILQVLISQKKN